MNYCEVYHFKNRFTSVFKQSAYNLGYFQVFLTNKFDQLFRNHR
jgi:hypothetical protein